MLVKRNNIEKSKESTMKTQSVSSVHNDRRQLAGYVTVTATYASLSHLIIISVLYCHHFRNDFDCVENEENV